MNNPFAEEENVWGESSNTAPNPTASVLFSANDNPYASAYGGFDNAFKEDGDEDDNGIEDNDKTVNKKTALEDVDFNESSKLTENAFLQDDDFDNNKIFSELGATMKSVTLDHAQATDPFQTKIAGDDDESKNEHEEELLKNAEVERLKEKQKQLLSSLIPEEDKLLTDSILSDAPKANENLFLTREIDNGPLGDVFALSQKQDPVSVVKANNTHPQNVVSPNKKKRLLRPRRGTRGKGKATVPSAVPNQTDSSDPLSINLSKANLSNSGKNASKDGSKKDNILKTVNEPLFGLKSPLSLSSSDSLKPNLSPKDQKSDLIIETPKEQQFDIAVGDPIKIGDLASAHIVYTITTKTKSDLLKAHEVSVTRRYRDFLWLYEQLLNNHPGYIIPPPPEKQVYGRFDDKFIENRRIALEKMLIKISKVPVLQKDYDFIIFLQSDNFAADSKERESLVYHGNGNADTSDSASSADFSVSSMVNSTATANQSGGFFSSIVGFNAPN
ncbi:unnamed protein product [Ambrosiozyma monospora]|uniref:Unnamed protein product n=1 Tax=Ambrosiozyma monospora TaxID=43982 RepID=A0ACB5T9T0_AMBMO|nr:unnamed protein product [Ambrosiozyma monospora]